MIHHEMIVKQYLTAQLKADKIMSSSLSLCGLNEYDHKKIEQIFPD